MQPVTQSLYRPHYADSFRVVVNLLRRISGPKRDEVTGKRRLHNKELYALYATPNNIREMKSRMRWARHVARMGDMTGADQALVGKPEGRKPLGRPRCRWEDNIKINLLEVAWGMDWIDLAQDKGRWRALVDAVMNLRFP